MRLGCEITINDGFPSTVDLMDWLSVTSQASIDQLPVDVQLFSLFCFFSCPLCSCPNWSPWIWKSGSSCTSSYCRRVHLQLVGGRVGHNRVPSEWCCEYGLSVRSRRSCCMRPIRSILTQCNHGKLQEKDKVVFKLIILSLTSSMLKIIGPGWRGWSFHQEVHSPSSLKLFPHVSCKTQNLWNII